ncbi:MAG: serine hydrolase family protein [Candidatus Sungbacteria bacterium]|nr:serine hydrolase family protein [Candidatus Sungbacteria bacterium]
MKRVFIVHGIYGHPQEGWFPWLKGELSQRGFRVRILKMPRADKPEIGRWISYLAKAVGDADENTFFVGHSVGCQAILRYLERLPKGQKAGGAILAGGWFVLANLEPEEEKKLKPWIKTSVNFNKIKLRTNKIVAVFSDNDPYVPLNKNKKIFAGKLGAKIMIVNRKSHFSGEDGIKKLPVVLKQLLLLNNKNVA